MGATMDEAATAQGLKLDTQLDLLNQKVVALKTSMGKEAAPALTGFVGLLNNIADAAAKASEKLGALGDSGLGKTMTALARLTGGPVGWAMGAVELAGAAGANAPQYASPIGPQPESREDALKRVRAKLVVIGYTEDGDAIYGDPAAKQALDMAEKARLIAMSAGFEPDSSGQLRGDMLSKQGAKGSTDALLAWVRVMAGIPPKAIIVGETFSRLSARMDAMAAASARMKSAVASSIGSAVDAVVSGGVAIGAAFRAMMQSIVESVAAAMVKLGIGLGLEALGLATGQPWITAIGKGVAGSGAMAPSGGDTYNISTLDAKTITDAIVAPTGSWRRANDRVREVALAGAM